MHGVDGVRLVRVAVRVGTLQLPNAPEERRQSRAASSSITSFVRTMRLHAPRIVHHIIRRAYPPC